jgi:hypothetical protein
LGSLDGNRGGDEFVVHAQGTEGLHDAQADLPSDLHRRVRSRNAERARELARLHDVGRNLGDFLDLRLELREPLFDRFGDRCFLRLLFELREPVVARERERLDLGKPFLELFELFRLRLDDLFLLEQEIAQLLIRRRGRRLLSGSRSDDKDEEQDHGHREFRHRTYPHRRGARSRQFDPRTPGCPQA